MKKKYVNPRLIAIDIASNETLLQSSYVDIGGKSDRFDARRRYRDFYAPDDEPEKEIPYTETPDVVY